MVVLVAAFAFFLLFFTITEKTSRSRQKWFVSAAKIQSLVRTAMPKPPANGAAKFGAGQ